MLTVDAISKAHSRVKSGADFPQYIQDCKNLGVLYYDTFVEDGSAIYYGENGYKVSLQHTYEAIPIKATLAVERFKDCLLSHQNGETDFIQFCKDCSETGIAKWKIDLYKMTCAYFDFDGNLVLIEQIPA